MDAMNPFVLGEDHLAFQRTVRDLARTEFLPKWAARIAAGDALGCYAVTEPDTGSDAAALRTRAERVAGGWRLTGEKTSVTQAPHADVAVVLAQTAPGSRALVAPLTGPGAGRCSSVPRRCAPWRVAHGMPTYRVNDTAVKQARKLIDAGTYDDTTEWSQAAPSAADANKEIDRDSFDEFASWHLAVDPDASEGTKGRYAFPYGDFAKVNRAALIHAKQRAAQNDHDEIEKAAADLLERLDRKRS